MPDLMRERLEVHVAGVEGRRQAVCPGWGRGDRREMMVLYKLGHLSWAHIVEGFKYHDGEHELTAY